MNKTGIQYLDFTWNPVTGCSFGCPECWARGVAQTRLAPDLDVKIKNIYRELNSELPAPKDDPYASHMRCYYLWDKRRVEAERLKEAYRTFKPTLHPERLAEPAKRKKPAVIGVCFMGDLFDSVNGEDELAPWASESNWFKVTRAMINAPQQTFILLTKRPDNMVNALEGLQYGALDGGVFENWFLGFSARTQAEFDAGWPRMAWLAAAGWKVWVSLEPMQEAIDIKQALPCVTCIPGGLVDGDVLCKTRSCGPKLSGVILGAQSGKNAPPLDLDWVRSIEKKCAVDNIPFMFKQDNSTGKIVSLPELDGRQHTALAWSLST